MTETSGSTPTGHGPHGDAPPRRAAGRPFESGTVFRLFGWRKWICRPLAALLWLYLRSLRLHMDAESPRGGAPPPAPRIFVSWHNRSLLAPIMAKRFFDAANVACLVSPSRSAAWEVAFYEAVGFRIVRGSSSRRGIAAARELIRELRGGQDIAVTPDGPSGPLHEIKRGALILARRSQAPVAFIIPNARHALRLPTWDRHLVPLPFSRVDVRLVIRPPYPECGYADESAALADWRAVLASIDEDTVRPGGRG
ncbi:MAG: DUF374 domain-containing protein [Opitutales bacterium]|nr:DUF374 domain-containing protein [Opitutales bacterium]